MFASACALTLWIGGVATVPHSPIEILPFVSDPVVDDDVKDRTLERLWRRMKDDDKREVIQWFTAEVEYLRTFQNGLLAYLLERQERPPKLWPEGNDEIPVFDPQKHAPAQPIPRKLKDSRSNERFRDRVLGKVPERQYETIWDYDYTTGLPTRRGEIEDYDRIFNNAVKGYHPQLDYAEALLEAMLDSGELRGAHAAFSHAYSDREGQVVPGVTLYDVWASGVDMEMPDVECLGIIHMVEDDWRTWRAPVASHQQDELYERLGEHFAAIRRQRDLNRTLARVYLNSEPAVPAGWEVYVDRFHALWEKHSSNPEDLQKVLPTSKKWEAWLEATGEEIDNSVELWQGGQRRKATLESDRAQVRATLVFVLREYGVLRK